jgi:O-antigen ligase
MTFKLFLLCSFVLLARPQEILVFLQPARPALVITILATAALLFGRRRQDLATALSTPESKRYLLLFLIMLLGIPFAHHRKFAFDGIFPDYAANVVFFFLLVSQVTTLQRLKSLVWVTCLSTMMYGVWSGLLQMKNFGGGRFQILEGNFDPNDTAYVLLALFPLCLYYLRFNEGLLKRLIAITAICGAVATLLLTGSRGGILGFGAVLATLLLSRTGGIGKGSKVLLAVVFASSWFLVKDRVDVDRYLSVADVSTDYNVTGEGGRLQLWKQAIDLSLANPLTGVGVNCYPSASYYSRMGAGESYQKWHTVHNSFLQIAAEVGLVGFAIYVLINLKSFLTFYRISKIKSKPAPSETGVTSTLSGLMLLGFVGLLVSGFFLSHGYSLLSTFYFALAAAMERVHARISAGTESTRGAVDASEPYAGGGIPAK